MLAFRLFILQSIQWRISDFLIAKYNVKQKSSTAIDSQAARVNVKIIYVRTREVIPNKAQPFKPWTRLENSKQKENGKIKTKASVAMFLFPNVDAMWLASLREKGLK